MTPRRFGRYDYITYLNFAGAQKNDNFTLIFKSTDCCSWTTGYIGHTCYADIYLDHRRWLQDVFDETITSLTLILLVLKKTTISHWYSNLLTAATEPQVILFIHAMLILILFIGGDSMTFRTILLITNLIFALAQFHEDFKKNWFSVSAELK